MSDQEGNTAPAETTNGAPDTDGKAEPAPAEAASPPEAPETDAPERELTAEEKLTQALEAAKAEAASNRERMLRVAADFENFRRRSTRELSDARKQSTREAVKQLLPVFDNLERATAHADATADAANLVNGLKMVHKQFIDTVGKIGVERVEAAGQPFDPTLHESIQYEPSDEVPAGHVLKELQPGYRMGEILLRPALVVVSKGPETPSTEAASAEDAAPEQESS